MVFGSGDFLFGLFAPFDGALRIGKIFVGLQVAVNRIQYRKRLLFELGNVTGNDAALYLDVQCGQQFRRTACRLGGGQRFGLVVGKVFFKLRPAVNDALAQYRVGTIKPEPALNRVVGIIPA